MVYDHLGSLAITLDYSGKIKKKMEYYAFGERRPGTDTTERDEYVGKQKDRELRMADHGAINYDAEIGRFTSVDPLWEKYMGWTPYQYCANNPMSFVDLNGNEIDVSQLFMVTGDNVIDQKMIETRNCLINDLREITGLNISISGNNIVSNGELSGNCGSQTAKFLLLDGINSSEKINISGSEYDPLYSNASLGGNDINLHNGQINYFISHTSDGLNNKTMGFGMTFFHEYGHTGASGSLKDTPHYPNYPGPADSRVNQIRKELDANGNGKSYGKRYNYDSNKVNGKNFIPFTTPDSQSQSVGSEKPEEAK